MNPELKRRDFLKLALAVGLLPPAARAWAAGGEEAPGALIAAAWRGPNPGDTYYAGVLAADWTRKKLEIRHPVALPTRPHGLLPEADGSLLVVGVWPGTWLLRCDAEGRVMQQVNLADEA